MKLKHNIKAVMPVAIILIIIVICFSWLLIKTIKIPQGQNPSIYPKEKIEEQLHQNKEIKIDETTTDAITGTVTKLTKDTISIKNDEAEKNLKLRSNTDVFSVDPEKGVIVRQFSEIKKGIIATANFTVKNETVVYLVIEKQ